ncbi:MAG TPA: hypothetical protein VK589_20175 [Chryseolinea sp.]|nr:hypothetical protein [Chryseolinea sp.]
MKNILTLTLLALMFQLAGCNSDDDANPKSQNAQLLTATPWSHAVVTHTTDGDLSDQYENFAISFIRKAENGYEGTFIISNGGYAFPENTGKWKFHDDNLGKIVFDSGRQIQYDVHAETLHLDFNVAAPGGRTNGLSGHFVFDLIPL